MRGQAKYGSHKVQTSEGTFDSRKEYRRYQELKLLEAAGEIADLKRQVKFTLIPAQYEEVSKEDYIKSKGKKTRGKLLERECAYYADFVYIDHGKIVVEDTKGMKTKDYIIKRKLMLYEFGIRILET